MEARLAAVEQGEGPVPLPQRMEIRFDGGSAVFGMETVHLTDRSASSPAAPQSFSGARASSPRNLGNEVDPEAEEEEEADDGDGAGFSRGLVLVQRSLQRLRTETVTTSDATSSAESLLSGSNDNDLAGSGVLDFDDDFDDDFADVFDRKEVQDFGDRLGHLDDTGDAPR